MTRAAASGVRLSEKDVSIVKAMLERGDRQHDIAAHFGVNGGRISEISTNKKFAWVLPAAQDTLPPAKKEASASVKELQKSLDLANTKKD